MIRLHRPVAAIALVAAIAVAGCDLFAPAPTTLTESQKHFVNNAFTQLQGFGGAASATSVSAEATEPTSKLSVDATFGDCPEVTIGLDEEAFSIGFDFGEGCEHEKYPDVTMTGSIEGTISFDDRSLDVIMDNFSTDGGPAVSGTMDLGYSKPDGSTVATFDAVVNLTTTDNGSLDVVSQWTYDVDTGLLTIVSVEGTAQDGAGSSYGVDHDNLVMDPRTHGNFVPQSGTTTIVATEPTGPMGELETKTIVVTYDENSPTTGVVQVSINGGEPFSHTLEGF